MDPRDSAGSHHPQIAVTGRRAGTCPPPVMLVMFALSSEQGRLVLLDRSERVTLPASS